MARIQGERLSTMETIRSAEDREPDLALYECGPLRFADTEDVYDRHVVFDHAVSLENASDRERFEAVARALRDLLTQRWLLTEQTYDAAQFKAGLLPVDGISDRPHAHS